MTFQGSLTVGRAGRVPGNHPSNTTAVAQLNYDITPDGREFVLTRRVSSNTWADGQGDRGSIKVVLNWFEELERLAPAKR